MNFINYIKVYNTPQNIKRRWVENDLVKIYHSLYNKYKNEETLICQKIKTQTTY